MKINVIQELVLSLFICTLVFTSCSVQSNINNENQNTQEIYQDGDFIFSIKDLSLE